MNGRAASAVVFVVVGLICQEIGASVAFLLFPHAGPLGMVMLRLVFSAVILLAIARPRLRGHSGADWWAVARFGLVLAVMNGLFYLALVSLPFGIVDAGGALLRIDLVALGAAVAVLSSTIPYALELIALRRIPASAFAVLMSLAPATAALAGLVLLGQHLAWLEVVGIGLVIIASIGAVRAAGRRAPEVVEPVG